MFADLYAHVKPHTTEHLVLYLALTTSDWSGFSIEIIRWDALFMYDTPLSYKQVRNAIFRLRAKGLPIRHICRGTYLWKSQQSANDSGTK